MTLDENGELNIDKSHLIQLHFAKKPSTGQKQLWIRVETETSSWIPLNVSMLYILNLADEDFLNPDVTNHLEYLNPAALHNQRGDKYYDTLEDK